MAMGQALLQLIPLGLAAALSSVPITATVFILLSGSRGRSGPAFMAGTVLGTFAAVTLATVAGQALPGRQRRHDDLIATLEVAVGVAMVVMGLITLVRRNRAATGRGRTWLDGIGSLGLVPVFGIALALSVRPKAVLLVTAAGLAISRANLRFEQNLVLAVLYTALATITVVVPIVATVLAPTWMEPRLLSMKAWISGHSTVVSALMLMLVGALVTVVGVSG
jgi:hypothetical protein